MSKEVLAAALRDEIEKIATRAARKVNPPSRVATVLSINEDALSAEVALAGDDGSFNATFGPSNMPKAPGVLVRVGGRLGSYFISEILNDAGVHRDYQPVIEVMPGIVDDLIDLNDNILPGLQDTLDEANVDIGVLRDTTIPALNDELDGAKTQIDTLNNTTIPGLNVTLTQANTDLGTLKNTTIPALNTSLATEKGRIDTLNNTTIPALNVELSKATSDVLNLYNVVIPDIGTSLNTLNNTTIPGLNSSLATERGRIDTLNNTTIPGLNSTLATERGRIDTLNNTTIPGINSSLSTERGRIDTLNNTTIPGINSALATERGRITTLTDTTIPNLNTALQTEQGRINTLTNTTIPNLNTALQAEQGRINTLNDVTIPGINTSLTTANTELTNLNSRNDGDTSTINDYFADWTGASPVGWTNPLGPALVKETVLVKTKPNAMRFNTPAGTVNHYLSQNITTVTNELLTADSYHTVFADVYLVSGDVIPSGILYRTTGTVGGVASKITDYVFKFSVELPNIQTGRWYRFSKTIKTNVTDNGKYDQVQVFPMSAWSAIGSGTTGRELIFGRLAARPASAAEIQAVKATADIVGLNTNLGTLNGKFPIVGTDITDGAISTPKITVNTLNGDRILVNTLQAGKIVAGSITSNEMTANTINGDRITANTLNASKIVAGSITSDRITVNTLTGDRILANSLDAGRITAGTIATDRMTANTINGDRVTANTLTAAKIIAGSITTDRMTSNTISGDVITANTLNAAKIVAGTITSDRITTNTLTGDRILANSLDAAKVTAGSITSDRITVNTLTGDRILANSLAADKIVANSITTGQLTANGINGDRITANTLNADKIIAGSITTTQMTANSINGDRITANTLNADKIVANSIIGDKIAANAISARNLTLGDFTNYAADGDLTDPTFSNWDANGLTRVTPAGESAYIEWQTNNPVGGNAHRYNKNYFEVRAGDEFYVECEVSTPSSNTAAVNVILGLVTYGANGAVHGFPQVGPKALAPGAAWTPYSGTITIAEGSVRGVFDPFANSTAASQTVRMRRMFVRKKSGANLIVDGAITTDKMTANTINGDRVTANTLNAGKIVAGTITSDLMTANTINGDRITANTLNASKIVAGSITSNEITANTINGDRITANTLAAGKIIAGSITSNEMTANTINGDRITANTLHADKIVAGSITTNQMTANSINGDRITAGTLHANKILANTLTADQIVATSFTGVTITGAILQTGLAGSERIVITNDGAGGVIQSYTGVANESPGLIDPGPYFSNTPALSMMPGTTPSYSGKPRIWMNAGAATAAQASSLGIRGSMNLEASLINIDTGITDGLRGITIARAKAYNEFGTGTAAQAGYVELTSSGVGNYISLNSPETRVNRLAPLSGTILQLGGTTVDIDGDVEIDGRLKLTGTGSKPIRVIDFGSGGVDTNGQGLGTYTHNMGITSLNYTVLITSRNNGGMRIFTVITKNANNFIVRVDNPSGTGGVVANGTAQTFDYTILAN